MHGRFTVVEGKSRSHVPEHGLRKSRYAIRLTINETFRIVTENEGHPDRAGRREGEDHGATDDFFDHLADLDGQEHYSGGLLRHVGLYVQRTRESAV